LKLSEGNILSGALRCITTLDSEGNVVSQVILTDLFSGLTSMLSMEKSFSEEILFTAGVAIEFLDKLTVGTTLGARGTICFWDFFLFLVL
jgi:hypothetical protein